MKKLVSRVLLAALVASVASFAIADHHGEEGSWTGIVTDTGCGAKGAKADHAACAHKCVKSGEKYALYTAADGKVWVLSNQDEAGKMAGKEVVVKGKADKEKMTIEVASMEAAPGK
jgi:predicted type IV restriction endonuclease